MSIYRKFWSLLTADQRRRSVVQVVLMLIGMVVETASTGLVIPVLGLLTQPDFIAKHAVLEPLFRGIGSHARFVVFAMLLLVMVYANKASYLAFLSWSQSHFVFKLQADISQRLFSCYLQLPYAFHLQRNSAELLRNIVTETNLFTYSALIPGTVILSEALVTLGISCLLFAIEPAGALMVGSTLAVASWGFYRLSRGAVLNWGEARQVHEGLRIQHIQQGMGGVKDIKLLGRTDNFLDEYQVHNSGSARAGEYQLTLQALPRLCLELLGVTGLAILVLAMVYKEKSLEALLPTLGLFAAAAFRLMPSVNRVLSSIQSFRYAGPAIDTLHKELSLANGTPAQAPSEVQPIPFQQSLAVDLVTFSYPSTEAQALKGVDLTIRSGTSVGLIGTTGSGKSTLVDIILGLLAPTKGVVRVDGVDIQSNLRGWQDQIGYVPQSIFLTDDTLRRNIAFGINAKLIDENAVWRALNSAQLDEFVKGLPDGLNTVVGERGVRLSGGQRQRIGIARALYYDPQILVLDEATSSLDMKTEQGVMEAVRSLHGEKTIIIVAHRLSAVEQCDRLYRLEQGCLVAEGRG